MYDCTIYTAYKETQVSVHMRRQGERVFWDVPHTLWLVQIPVFTFVQTFYSLTENLSVWNTYKIYAECNALFEIPVITRWKMKARSNTSNIDGGVQVKRIHYR